MMNDDDDIDALSDDINKMSTSDELFQDPPPKEDCPLCSNRYRMQLGYVTWELHTCHVVESPYVKDVLWLHTGQ